ncbi:hypothetical protein QBC45DRAFT_72843 [Copromyces sp. CBS 386.78]|nr:hypothetical protein QBC45DRAFT_72843 [Copromyces sp. CBS 386.78]
MSHVFWHTVPSPEDPEPFRNLRLPPKLWHVQHDQSQSINLKEGGFQARNPHLDIRTFDALKTEATRHFIWATREWDSCFLSTFDDQTHAENWAQTMKRLNKEPIVIYELDTSKLPPRTTVLQSTPLCLSLDIDHPWMQHEWIFHQQIPASCITRRYCPWHSYSRIFQSSLHPTGLAEVLVGSEWHPARNHGGARPPSPARTEGDQDDLDDLTGRMNGLDLSNGSRTSNFDTPSVVGSVQEVVNIEPADDALNGSASAHRNDVESSSIVGTPNDNEPIKQEEGVTDSRPTDDAPKTNDPLTEAINPTPTLDTSNVNNAVKELVNDTQLSGETAVADYSVKQEVIDLTPKNDPSKAGPGSAMQNIIMWEVNKEVLKEVLEAKLCFSVMVQLEVRVADEI